MSQQRKRQQIETLLGSSGLSVTQISKKLGVSVATVYRVKSRKQHNVDLEYHKGAGRSPRLRLSVKRSVLNKSDESPIFLCVLWHHLPPVNPHTKQSGAR